VGSLLEVATELFRLLFKKSWKNTCLKKQLKAHNSKELLLLQLATAKQVQQSHQQNI
jgi:hypothetical protein